MEQINELEIRVGDKAFLWINVSDIIPSPSQLHSLEDLGLVRPIGKVKGYRTKIWVLTSEALKRVFNWRKRNGIQLESKTGNAPD